MSPKFLFLLVGAGALVFACGPRTGQSDVSAHTAVRKVPAARAKSERAPSLTATLAIETQRSVALSLRVVNRGDKRVEIKFPNARTHDFVVLDAVGREVWRWSAGRMFTQSMQNRVLGASDALSFVERWTPPAEGGTFTAVAIFTSSNHPLEQRAQFTVAPTSLTTASR